MPPPSTNRHVTKSVNRAFCVVAYLCVFVVLASSEWRWKCFCAQQCGTCRSISMMKNSFNSQNRKSDIHFAELYLKRFSLPFSRTNLHASSVVISESLAHHNNISIIILCLSLCMQNTVATGALTHSRAQHQQQSLFRFIHFRISVAHLCVSGEIVLGYSVHDHNAHTPVQTSATHTDAHSWILRLRENNTTMQKTEKWNIKR